MSPSIKLLKLKIPLILAVLAVTAYPTHAMDICKEGKKNLIADYDVLQASGGMWGYMEKISDLKDKSTMAQSYRELVVWQRSMDLVTATYRMTQGFPRDEVYGLTSQIRRSAVSVPSNIAEGQGRRTAAEFQQFLGQARGSLLELETQILIARNLDYLTEEQAASLLSATAEVGRTLNGLLTSIKRQ